ncbi:MAG TPA: hypothetical protein VGD99_25885 [Anaerolineae bacterium]|jgi:hypothetical protein
MRTLGSKKNKPAANPISTAALVITNVITPIGLEPDDQKFVSGEIKWLFSAMDNFLQVYHSVQQRIDEENTRLIKKYALDVLSDRKRKQELEEFTPKVWQEEIENSPPISEPIPPDTEKSPEANNRILPNLKEYKLDGWGRTIDSQLNNLSRLELKNLNTFIERETLQGDAAKSNVALQNELKIIRLQIVKGLQKIADQINEIYGILITSPGQLVEYLEEQ